MTALNERAPVSRAEAFRSLADVQVPAERVFTFDWMWSATSRHSGVRIGGKYRCQGPSARSRRRVANERVVLR